MALRFALTCTLLLTSTIAQQSAPPNASTLAIVGATFEASEHADPTLSFYQTPSNFSDSLEPGTLLLVEDATNLVNYTVPSGLTMSRIIYTTSSLNGTILPTSAFILWPYAQAPPETGYPLVAWAHGTSGVLHTCAPSNYRSLQYHFMVSYSLALQGIAVVAPDYAGLGIDTLPNGEKFRHPWLAAPAQANDLGNAIIAARSAFPSLLHANGSFVAMGHSQGGRTSWAYAERQAQQPIAGYKGTVTIAPPTEIITSVDIARANPQGFTANATLGQQVEFIDAITTVFPAYNYSGFTDITKDRWFNVYLPTEACLVTTTLVFGDLDPLNLAKPNWTSDPTVQEFFKLTDVGKKKFAGPHLIIQGELDVAVNPVVVADSVNATCAMSQSEGWGQSIEYLEYAGVSHFSVIQASQTKWMGWIKEKLGVDRTDWSAWSEKEQKEKQPLCQSSWVEGFRTEKSNQFGAAPNFFLEWYDLKTSGYKYIL